jgi:hypothetical protein
MRALLLVIFAGAAFGQGTEPKAKADAYEVHGQAKSAAVGAEFMVHSFSRGEQMYLAEDFLVVEVALFPPKGTTMAVQNGNFALRMNGKKQLLLPMPAAMVAESLKHPEWQQRGGGWPEMSGGVGNTGVVLGGPPRNQDPFPGSRPPGQTPPQTVPIPRDNGGVQKQAPVKADELLLQTALVEGEHHAAFSGFLFFPYKGKTSGIKSLELLYDDAVFKLR